MQTNLYICFNGNCEDALKFYARTLGGNIECLMRFEGTPAAAHAPSDWGKKVLHAQLDIGGQKIMATDAPPSCYEKPSGFSILLQPERANEAERLFTALGEGGRVIMPLQETFWAERYGQITDQFGIQWKVNCVKAVQTAQEPEEYQTAAA